MVFSDLFFLFVFLPAFALCYLAAHWIDQLLSSEDARPNRIVENAVLVVFSLIFYAWGEPVYVFLMLFCVLLNYLAGLGIGHTQGTARKWALAGGLTGNILILSTFKYLSFFAQQLTALGIPVADPKIALPIGISFYTFQSISYLIDVYRQEAPMQRHFGNLLLYISMFPQLIAGPIVRYNTVAQEISNRSVTSKDVADGIYRFVIGLGKKVILAKTSPLLAHGQASWPLPCRSTSTSPAILIWLSDWGAVWASTSTRTSVIPIVVIPSPTSGDGGISHWVVSSVTMCISLWVVTEVIRPLISSWCGFSQVCGTEPAGTSSSGVCISVSS